MWKSLMEKVDNMHDQAGTLSRVIGTGKKKIIEKNNSVTDEKYLQ